MSRTETISVAECAKRLGLTTRQVTRLRAEGMPASGDKVLWPAARVWRDEQLIERGKEQATGRGDWKVLRDRKTAAEAELAEIQVARQRGELLSVREVERTWGQVLNRLRARILAAPGKYAPRLGIPIAQAQVRLEEFTRELIAELADTADELVDEEAEPDA